MPNDKFIITDFGETLKINDAKTGKHLFDCDRYGVWRVINNVAKEVVQTGSDLEALKAEFNVQEVFRI